MHLSERRGPGKSTGRRAVTVGVGVAAVVAAAIGYRFLAVDNGYGGEFRDSPRGEPNRDVSYPED